MTSTFVCRSCGDRIDGPERPCPMAALGGNRCFFVRDGHWFEEAAATAAMTELESLRLVVDAADNLVRVKREAEKAFRTGLDGMPGLVRTSPLHKGLADATKAAGRKLEYALDTHLQRFPR